MKVTYSISVGTDLKVSDIATRVLTENLLKNDKFDANFSYAVLEINHKTKKDATKILSKITKPRNVLIEIYGMELINKWKMLSLKYKDLILDSIKGDYLFYTVRSEVDYEIIKYLISRGVRVIYGGTKVKKLVDDNAIMVNGNITPSTDLHKIIKNWKDFNINEISNEIFYAKRDYTRNALGKKMRNIIKSMEHIAPFINVWADDTISIMFDNKCIWNKCRFCSYPDIRKIKLTDGMTSDEIVDAIMRICNHLDSYNVFIADDYFYFNEKRLDVIKKLVKKGVSFRVQTGIHLLKNEKNAERIMRYFKFFSIGLENATDYGLTALNKGYLWEDIEKAMENIKKYYNDNIISVNIITDSPCDSESNVHLNYKRLLDLKNEMINSGIVYFYNLKLLHIFTPRIFKSFADLNYIRKPQFGNSMLSGRFYLWEEMSKITELSDLAYENGVPFERIDVNGNIVPSDFLLMDYDTMRELFYIPENFHEKI